MQGKKRWMSDASPLALSSSTVRQECLSLNLTQLQCIIVSSTLSWLYLPAAYTDRLFYLFRYTVLPPFHNIRFYSIVHIYLDINKFRHMYVFKFINIYIYIRNARKCYIVKWREHILCPQPPYTYQTSQRAPSSLPQPNCLGSGLQQAH